MIVAGQPDEARSRLARLTDGYLVSQLLHVAAALEVPDRLASGPRRVDELAGEAGVGPDLLRRVLRGLATEGVLEELPGAVPVWSASNGPPITM